MRSSLSKIMACMDALEIGFMSTDLIVETKTVPSESVTKI